MSCAGGPCERQTCKRTLISVAKPSKSVCDLRKLPCDENFQASNFQNDDVECRTTSTPFDGVGFTGGTQTVVTKGACEVGTAPGQVMGDAVGQPGNAGVMGILRCVCADNNGGEGTTGGVGASNSETEEEVRHHAPLWYLKRQ